MSPRIGALNPVPSSASTTSPQWPSFFRIQVELFSRGDFNDTSPQTRKGFQIAQRVAFYVFFFRGEDYFTGYALFFSKRAMTNPSPPLLPLPANTKTGVATEKTISVMPRLPLHPHVP